MFLIDGQLIIIIILSSFLVCDIYLQLLKTRTHPVGVARSKVAEEVTGNEGIARTIEDHPQGRGRIERTDLRGDKTLGEEGKDCLLRRRIG